MAKKLILALALCLMLAGCQRPEAPPATDPATQAATTAPVAGTTAVQPTAPAQTQGAATQPPATQPPAAAVASTTVPAGTGEPVIPVSGLSLGARTLALDRGGSHRLDWQVSPQNATDPSVTWRSDNPSVVAVDGQGGLTALAAGTADIIATAGGLEARCTVTVTVAVQSVELRVQQTRVEKNQTFTLWVAVYPQDATDQTVQLTSGNSAVLAQTEDGQWAAVGPGTADIIAVAGGVTGRLSITVIVPVASLTLEHREATINRGERLNLGPALLPADATERGLTFISSNPAVATVSADGAIRAVSAGSAVITCTAESGAQDTCAVTVVVPVERVVVSLDRTRFKLGETAAFQVAVYPEDATDKRYTLSASGGNALLAGGSLSCDSAGSATITATAENGVKGEKTVTIIDLVAYADEVLRLTNAQRENSGLSALSATSGLTQTAVQRAGELITVFSHDRPGGKSCFTAYSENGVSYTTAGENIAKGYKSPADVVDGWMNSPGHKANIMNSDFGKLGVGVDMDSSGALYWSQNFTD